MMQTSSVTVNGSDITPSLRARILEEIKHHFNVYGNGLNQSAEEIEGFLFQRASSRDEYLTSIAKTFHLIKTKSSASASEAVSTAPSNASSETSRPEAKNSVELEKISFLRRFKTPLANKLSTDLSMDVARKSNCEKLLKFLFAIDEPKSTQSEVLDRCIVALCSLFPSSKQELLKYSFGPNLVNKNYKDSAISRQPKSETLNNNNPFSLPQKRPYSDGNTPGCKLSKTSTSQRNVETQHFQNGSGTNSRVGKTDSIYIQPSSGQAYGESKGLANGQSINQINGQNVNHSVNQIVGHSVNQNHGQLNGKPRGQGLNIGQPDTPNYLKSDASDFIKQSAPEYVKKNSLDGNKTNSKNYDKVKSQNNNLRILKTQIKTHVKSQLKNRTNVLGTVPSISPNNNSDYSQMLPVFSDLSSVFNSRRNYSGELNPNDSEKSQEELKQMLIDERNEMRVFIEESTENWLKFEGDDQNLQSPSSPPTRFEILRETVLFEINSAFPLFSTKITETETDRITVLLSIPYYIGSKNTFLMLSVPTNYPHGPDPLIWKYIEAHENAENINLANTSQQPSNVNKIAIKTVVSDYVREIAPDAAHLIFESFDVFVA